MQGGIIMNKKKFIDYQEQLLKQLQDEEFASGYLNEALNDEDPRIFLLTLKNVIAAQEDNISSIAKESNITSYKHLSNIIIKSKS